MKTAISIPDELFDSAETLASRLGVSRSELYATAIARLIAEHERSQITTRLNAVYGEGPEVSRLEPGFASLQVRALGRAAGASDGKW